VKFRKLVPVILMFFFASCGTNVKPVLYDESTENFIIVIRDITPNESSRCYYMISVDREEIGRTEISPETIDKKFVKKMAPGEYKISIKKYVVDESAGRYVPVNNLDQPKPASQTVIIPPQKMVRLSIIHNSIQQRTSWNVTVY